MASPPQTQDSAVLNLDKEEGGSDPQSSLYSSSSTRRGHGHGADPYPLPMTAKDDVEAYPVGMNEGNEIKKTTTKSSWRDVAKALTKTTTKSSWKDPGPPPDGGLTAWTQVAMGHLVIMNTWGFINSFGVFQTYYTDYLGRPPSDISWVGSIQVFLLFFIGTWTGRLTDAGYFKQVFIFGTILQFFGIFMTSLSTQYWQLFLTQGVCVGLGNGCLFCPMMSMVSTYFSKRRNIAIGVVACGSATGGLVFPAMVQQLLPKVGFGWTMRAIGFVELGCLTICILFLKQRLPPRRSGPMVEWAAFKEMPYSLFAAGMFFVFWGVYFAFYYLGAFARNVIGVNYAESINLILVLNGVGLIGRLAPNHFADSHTGPMNMMIPVCAASMLTLYCMIAVKSRGALYGWAIVYGIFGAAIQSLFPAVLSSLTTDLRKAGVRMGMIFSIVSFAVLTGPPIAGLLVQRGYGQYLYAQLFAATAILIGTVFMLSSRIATSGLHWSVKM